MLTKEYELFYMEPGEFVESMQTWFLNLINKLYNLGKTFYNKDCANKIMRSMCSEWQPKVTTIKDSNDLSSLDITKLFGKLAEHGNELKWLTEREVKSKKEDKVNEEKQNLSLKTSSSRTEKIKDEDDSFDEGSSKEEETELFVKRYNQYMRKHKLKNSDKNIINFKKYHLYKKEHKRKIRRYHMLWMQKIGSL